jgi:CDP-glycerol glycerophosphotransferase
MFPWHLAMTIRADVFVCTHGLGVLAPIQSINPDLPIVDVWHGIGFKSRREIRDKAERFTAHFVASDWVAQRYIALGIPPSRIRVTGHAVWDALIQQRDTKALHHAYGLEGEYRLRILIAPTWTHGKLGEERPIFGEGWSEVLKHLSAWAVEHEALIVFRSHLNAGGGPNQSLANVVSKPYRDFPATYDILYAADILITDWSSIAMDYLATRRCTIYLDVEPPFAPSFLQDADRVGPRVSSIAGLLDALSSTAADEEHCAFTYRDDLNRLHRKIVGESGDGLVAARCLAECERIAIEGRESV